MTPERPPLTDRTALARNRERALRMGDDGFFLHRLAQDEIKERLALVKKSFTKPALVTGFAEIWDGTVPAAHVFADQEALGLRPRAHDLVVHAMALHWADDPLGQIIQSARALRPDGLFLACLFGGQTLQELRIALAEAEAEISGGLSPRILPMAEIRDLGGLLQRAGLALPVADLVSRKAAYPDMFALMHDLRAMGEGNALAARSRAGPRRAVLDRAAEIYQQNYPAAAGIVASFDIIFLSGWAPHSDQPRPLRPGSATHSLDQALERAKSTPRD